jgi:hypothetical protein
LSVEENEEFLHVDSGEKLRIERYFEEKCECFDVL